MMRRSFLACLITLSLTAFAQAQGNPKLKTIEAIRFGPNGHLPPSKDAERTQMGYEFYPEALEATIRKAARISGCPVIVTENGIGTEDDSRRIAFTRRALEGVLAAIAGGVDVRGYVHWSLLDNFEWLEGYRPKFGLVAVDRENQARKPKPSAYWQSPTLVAGGLPVRCNDRRTAHVKSGGLATRISRSASILD